jgi:glycosyltransferase involved in cell wall biosynthesis
MQPQAMPKITIVTTSFNQGHFIEETMRSVINQGYPNLEYIVIDGGSKDSSVDIIRKYEASLAYWVSEKDRGPADAIAKGFKRATGSIIAWLNSDDVYQPGSLAKAAAAFNADPNVDVVYGNCYWMDREGHVLAEKRQTPFSAVGFKYGGADLQQPATFWKRDLYERCGGLDPDFRAAFDMDLFFRFIDHHAKFKHIDDFLASFRVHSEQISDVLLATAKKEVELIRSRHLRYPVLSVPGRILRNIGRLQRIFWYTWQGDLPWMLSRIPDRWKSRFGNEAAGPRSKWV